MQSQRVLKCLNITRLYAIDLRLRKHLDNTSGLFERYRMVPIDIMCFPGIGGDNDKWDFHVSGVLFGCPLVAFQDVLYRRRLAEQVKIGVESGSQ